MEQVDAPEHGPSGPERATGGGAVGNVGGEAPGKL